MSNAVNVIVRCFICIFFVSGISRKNMFSWFLYQDKGYHADMPCVSIVPVTWVRVEPDLHPHCGLGGGGSGGAGNNMTIDGEAVEFGTFEAGLVTNSIFFCFIFVPN